MAISKEYRTRQRAIILEYLMQNSHRHITVHDIMDYLYSCRLSVGQTTVYRYLDRLVAEGSVRRFPSPDSATCYQYVGGGECCSHYHLKCRGCGKLIHIECEAVDLLAAHFADRHGFVIDTCSSVFYGMCAECAGGAE